jgi:hypothetical protein
VPRVLCPGSSPLPGETFEVDRTVLGRCASPCEHHRAVDRAHRWPSGWRDHQTARERHPPQTVVEGQERRLADQQRERHTMVVMQGGDGSTQTSGRRAAALGLRVGFHAPDTTDLDGCVVQRSRADHEADMGYQRALRSAYQDTLRRRSPLEVPAWTHCHDFWGVDRRRECLERGALIVVEPGDRFQVTVHRPSDAADAMER